METPTRQSVPTLGVFFLPGAWLQGYDCNYLLIIRKAIYPLLRLSKTNPVARRVVLLQVTTASLKGFVWEVACPKCCNNYIWEGACCTSMLNDSIQSIGACSSRRAEVSCSTLSLWVGGRNVRCVRDRSSSFELVSLLKDQPTVIFKRGCIVVKEWRCPLFFLNTWTNMDQFPTPPFSHQVHPDLNTHSIYPIPQTHHPNHLTSQSTVAQ